MGQVDPVALEEVLHLQVEQPGVGEDLAIAAVDAAGWILDQGPVQFPRDIIERDYGHDLSSSSLRRGRPKTPYSGNDA
jgi:hypothetical protein